MTALTVQPAYPIFTDTDGQPLENGYIWIGTANLAPQTNPINVYWDSALSQSAAQPIRTINGYPSNNGTPGNLYVGSDYSILVQDKNARLVYSAADSNRFAQISGQGDPIDIASATTIDIGGQSTDFLRVTGTTTITGFGANYTGQKVLIFSGVLTLTHNATALILPGGASITTAAGDSCIVVPKASVSGTANGWQVVSYQRATGLYAKAGFNTDIASLSGLVSRGLQFASTNAIDLAAVIPTTGSYIAGDIVFESTTGVYPSGWKRITTGANHVLGIDWDYFPAKPVLSTAVNTTSGAAIDFTSIPSWVKRVTVMFNRVSTNGTSGLLVQIGAGSIDTTGYISGTSAIGNSVTGSLITSTAGIIAASALVAAQTLSGAVSFILIGSNIWVASGTTYSSGTGTYAVAGSKTLSGTLDRIRITTINGTDTFDSGYVNILYE